MAMSSEPDCIDAVTLMLGNTHDKNGSRASACCDSYTTPRLHSVPDPCLQIQEDTNNEPGDISQLKKLMKKKRKRPSSYIPKKKPSPLLNALGNPKTVRSALSCYRSLVQTGTFIREEQSESNSTSTETVVDMESQCQKQLVSIKPVVSRVKSRNVQLSNWNKQNKVQLHHENRTEADFKRPKISRTTDVVDEFDHNYLSQPVLTQNGAISNNIPTPLYMYMTATYHKFPSKKHQDISSVRSENTKKSKPICLNKSDVMGTSQEKFDDITTVNRSNVIKIRDGSNVRSYVPITTESSHSLPITKSAKALDQVEQWKLHKSTPIVNTTMKPVSCTKCSKSFSSIDILHAHSQAVHQTKTTNAFNCQYCGNIFLKVGFLKKHEVQCSAKKGNE